MGPGNLNEKESKKSEGNTQELFQSSKVGFFQSFFGVRPEQFLKSCPLISVVPPKEDSKALSESEKKSAPVIDGSLSCSQPQKFEGSEKNLGEAINLRENESSDAHKVIDPPILDQNNSSSEIEEQSSQVGRCPSTGAGKNFNQSYRTETKNIIKNFRKRLIIFVRDNKSLILRLLISINSPWNYDDLNKFLQAHKKQNTDKIGDLRSFWTPEPGNPFHKEIRVITEFFLRKHCLHWIFNSKIQDPKKPLKYRFRIREGVRNPSEFVQLKFL